MACAKIYTIKPGQLYTHKSNTMHAYKPAQLLDILQQDTETQLDKAIREWQMTAPETLSRRPSSTQWSAKQCLSHLNGYGLYYLPAIEKAIDRAAGQGKDAGACFSPGWLGNYFTRMMQTTDNGAPAKKMKTFKKHDPPNDEDAHAVTALFIEQQEKLLALIEKARLVNLGAARIPISIAPFIRLKLGDVLMFVIAHNMRHFRQAERALAVSQHPA
jgi:hypothetical protein